LNERSLAKIQKQQQQAETSNGVKRAATSSTPLRKRFKSPLIKSKLTTTPTSSSKRFVTPSKRTGSGTPFVTPRQASTTTTTTTAVTSFVTPRSSQTPTKPTSSSSTATTTTTTTAALDEQSIGGLLQRVVEQQRRIGRLHDDLRAAGAPKSYDERELERLVLRWQTAARSAFEELWPLAVTHVTTVVV
jgi:hypothetical protein